MLSLIKLEGTLDHAICYVTLNNRLSDVFTDLNARPSVSLSNHSLLRIIIKSSEDKIIGNVSIHTSLLPLDTPQWLPLQNSLDQLKSLPETTHSPRVLIILNSDNLASVPEVSEISSADAQNECPDDLSALLSEKNALLREKINELEMKISEERWETYSNEHERLHNCQQRCNELSILLNKSNTKCQQLEVVKNELENRNNSLEILYKQERYQREYLEKQVLQITQSFEEAMISETKKSVDFKNEISSLYSKLRNAQEIIDSLQVRLKECEIQRDENNRNTTIANIQDANEKQRQNLLVVLQERFEESEFQRKVLKEKLDNFVDTKFEEKSDFLQNSCKTYYNEYLIIKNTHSGLYQKISSLQSELESKSCEISKLEALLVKSQKETSENLKYNQSKLSSKLSELSVKYSEYLELQQALKASHAKIEHNEGIIELLSNQIKTLSEKLALAKQRVFELSLNDSRHPLNSSKLSSGNADERFSEYLKNYGVEHHFERVSEGVYTFGSKKVSITIKNGYLVCRVGGGYMMIEEFLKLFLTRDCKNDNDEDVQNRRLLSEQVSPGSHSNRVPHKRASTLYDYEDDRSQTERIFEYEYHYNNPINGLRENSENSPGRYKFSPSHKKPRAFTPLRKNMCKRIFK